MYMDSFVLDSFKTLKFGMHDVVAWGEAAACFFMTHLKLT